MGNTEPPKVFNKAQEKLKFEIACIKVKSNLELKRDRSANEASAKEK